MERAKSSEAAKNKDTAQTTEMRVAENVDLVFDLLVFNWGQGGAAQTNTYEKILKFDDVIIGHQPRESQAEMSSTYFRGKQHLHSVATDFSGRWEIIHGAFVRQKSWTSVQAALEESLDDTFRYTSLIHHALLNYQ